MDKDKVLDTLEHVLEEVVLHIREDSINIGLVKDKSSYYVKRVDDLYNIHRKENDSIVYSKIIDIDFVRVIIRCLDKKQYTTVREVLDIEQEYGKHVIDMMHYLHSYKATTDAVLKETLAERFEVSKHLAMKIKNNLATYEITVHK